MSESIIEQVKRLAEAQKGGEQASCYSHSRTIVSCIADDTDFVALLAHLERMQAVVVAARKAKHYLEHRTTCKYLWDGVECDCGYISVSAALDAALSRIAALTGEKK